MFSVLVAVYNAEQYLAECLDSMLAQTYRDIQVVCVDDCSIDRSRAILLQYADRDSRIEVVCLDRNQGLSHARNVALQHARGEYICMLDADDCYSADAFEKAAKTFETFSDTDCVLFRLVMTYPDGRESEFPLKHFESMSGYEAMQLSINWQGIHGLYAIRSSIHHKYPYDETTRIYSDENTSRLHFLKSRVVRGCEGVYYYRQNSQSVTHKAGLGYFDHLEANYSLLCSLQAERIGEDVVQTLVDRLWLYVVDCYGYAYNNRSLLGKESYRQAMIRIRHMWGKASDKPISRSLRHKFGYIPFAGSWIIFNVQERIYFFLKSAMKLIVRL